MPPALATDVSEGRQPGDGCAGRHAPDAAAVALEPGDALRGEVASAKRLQVADEHAVLLPVHLHMHV